MTTPVGVALLSFAHAHQNHWAEVFASDPRSRIVGVWDDQPERGRSGAERLGAPWVADLDELLSRDDVTAVAICAANDDKPELVRRAARAGRHILIEKPTAARADDIPAMIRAVAEAGVTCVQSFPHRLVPNNRRVKEILDAGTLGRVGVMRKRHGHGFALEMLATDMPWIVDPRSGGGGALLDEGIHEVDLLRWYFGEPESVYAEAANLQTELPVDDNGVAVFRFPGGVMVTLASSWTWRAGGPTTEVYGTDGTLLQFRTDCASNDAPDPAGMELRLWRHGAAAWEEVGERDSFSGIHHRMARHFLDVLVDGVTPSTTLEDGYRAQVVMEAAYRASKTGERQKLVWHEGDATSGVEAGTRRSGNA